MKTLSAILWLAIAAATVFFLAALFSGCTSFSISQDETAPDGTRRHTTTHGFALFDSKSELAKVRATTTDKSQIQSIGALSQEASSTGAVQMLKIVVEAAPK
jgi:hypothetical protein